MSQTQNQSTPSPLYGTADDDVLLGQDGQDIYGGQGNDQISGSSGYNRYLMSSGDGHDIIATSGGDDVLEFGATPTFRRDGVDLLVIGDNGALSARILNWFTPGTSQHMLAAVVANGVTYLRDAITETALTIHGTAGADSITGTAGYSDIVYGNDGDDFIDVSQQSGVLAGDKVYGGNGNDTILGSNAADWLYGDAGNDYIDGGGGADHIFGGIGNDGLYSSGDGASLYGEAGNDLLYTSGNNSFLSGGDGSDNLIAAGSYNLLHGGSGSDILDLRGDYNVAYGGTGVDNLFSSGVGNTFVWQNGDSQDIAMNVNASTLFKFDDGNGSYGLTATKVGQSLRVSSSTGGGVMVLNWFDGANQMSFETPDGTTWTPAQINANFSEATYSLSYSGTLVHGMEDFGTVVASYFPIPAYTTRPDTYSVLFSDHNITGYQQAGTNFMQWAQYNWDGLDYWSGTINVSGVGAIVQSSGDSGHYNESYIVGGYVNFHAWQGADGSYEFAIVSSQYSQEYISRQPAPSNYYYQEYIGSGFSHATRQVTQLTEEVSSFEMAGLPSTQARAISDYMEASASNEASRGSEEPHNLVIEGSDQAFDELPWDAWAPHAQQGGIELATMPVTAERGTPSSSQPAAMYFGPDNDTRTASSDFTMVRAM